MVKLVEVKEERKKTPRKDGKKRWEMLTCTCDSDPLCNRCDFEAAENSIPTNEFKVKDLLDDGKVGPERTVTKITVLRGSMDDVIGWVF